MSEEACTISKISDIDILFSVLLKTAVEYEHILKDILVGAVGALDSSYFLLFCYITKI